MINNEFESTELDEDMEVVGPGQMLSQARTALGLSTQNIAEQLKLRLALIVNIEKDVFEKNISETYIRGYLRSYAKIVRVSEEDILASYKMLSVAKTQCAEMKSFSKITEKQAANSLLMWVTYLILFILLGSTVMWWLQNTEGKIIPVTEKKHSQVDTTKTQSVVEVTDALEINGNDLVNDEKKPISKDARALISTDRHVEIQAAEIATEQPLLANAVFSFSGDCWVKVFDATGTRIAVGVKKAGYVMNISGIAPLKVTVGKPELVQISFNAQTINMAQFDSGNIAKFTLPLKLNAE